MPRKRPIPDGGGEYEVPRGPDWRQPLFFLHGTVDTEDGVTVFEGTWVASDEGLPSLASFEESRDSFRLTTGDFLDTGVPLEEASPIGRSGKFGGIYKVGSGEVPRKYSDLDHKMSVMDHTVSCSLVAERGTSEFGAFVSLGRLIFPRDPHAPVTLTLARRYVTDDDVRAKLTTWEALFRIASKTRGLREKDDFANGQPAPWKLLPLKELPGQPAPSAP